MKKFIGLLLAGLVSFGVFTSLDSSAAGNGQMIIVNNNGVMDGNDPQGLAGAPTPVSSSIFHVFGHSLFTYTGGDDATPSQWTTTGEWLGLLAQASGTSSAGTYTFGQFTNHNSQPWPNANVQGGYASNSFDPAPNGSFPGHSYEHFYLMPSNFLEADMGMPPHSQPVTTATTDASTLIDNILSVYPSAEIFLYVHWGDAGTYPGAENMLRASFDTYNTDQQTTYLDWHIAWQDALVASGRGVRTIPVGPIIGWLFENESYLQSVDFNQVYGDSAPHGSENIYFLAALICYRAIYGQDPNIASFTFPAGATQMLPEVTDNAAALVSAVRSRLNYHNANGVLVF
ncbi:MAG: hypothetical protein K6L81_02575 [Agarilytica sp.]